MTPNWFATVVLLSWPIVAFWLYRTRPLNQATLWTILGAQLLLPVGLVFKLAPGIPQLDKYSIPAFAALIGCILNARRTIFRWNRVGFVEILLVLALIGPLITSEMNTDAIRIALTDLPALDQYEAVSAVIGICVKLIPFFVGRQILRNSSDNEEILRILVIAGLIYSLPMLFEIRMSPQLNYRLYGYEPSQFIQEVRESGFRPVVFMGHGLLASFFIMTTVVAAAALWKLNTRVKSLPPSGVTGYLGGLLILCQSAGALVYGLALVPLARWTRPRLQLRIACVLVSISLTYPMLRIADLFPADAMISIARSISADRAASLQTRFDQERRLLERASQRLLFGWGRFGRSRIYEEEMGNDVSLTDGYWIIELGQFGLFGFLAEFGLLTLPVFRAALLRSVKGTRDDHCLAALALIVAVNIVDLLPNSFIMPWTWLLAGALLGRTEALRSKSAVSKIGSGLNTDRRPLEPHAAGRFHRRLFR